MQKYIAVVNPRMDDDEISHLIGKGIAGALFQISHGNYSLAAKLISQIKNLSRKHNRPVSIIQDTSLMEDPVDLEFGVKGGADWISSHNADHLNLARKLNKNTGLIYKGRVLPKGLRVDSIMSSEFLDPDAQVAGTNFGQIKHLVTSHPDQDLLDSILDLAVHSDVSGIAVSDLDLAKTLSWRRPTKKIIFAPRDHQLASKGSIYWGVHPIFTGKDLVAGIRNAGLMNLGERVMDLTDSKHAVIHLV